MAGINIKNILGGIMVFAISYILFVLGTPILNLITQQAANSSSVDSGGLAWIQQMGQLNNYGLFISACVGIAYVGFSGLREEDVINEL